MRALVATGDDELVRIADVDEPAVPSDGVLVDVRAVSVNRGELHRLQAAVPDRRPGWDFAGTVAASRDDRWPCGTPVCGFSHGGSWAEQVCVRGDQLARVPPVVPLSQAAALPVAGLTALRVLRLAGDLDGRRVLVTGASGGVGRYVVQLARRSGAHVSVALAESGARFDVVLESAGGASLRTALGAVADGGLVVSFGNSSRTETIVDGSDFYPRQASLRGYYLLTDVVDDPPAKDLAHLVDLVARGDLCGEVTKVADWQDAALVLAGLRSRELRGKAVLEVSNHAAGRTRT